MPHFFVVYRLVRDRYSTFLLLGVSSPWLLLAVSLTRHFPLLAITQRFLYSTYPMKGITCIFTQTFHYPTFQLLDVSALPPRCPILNKNFVWGKLGARIVNGRAPWSPLRTAPVYDIFSAILLHFTQRSGQGFWEPRTRRRECLVIPC